MDPGISDQQNRPASPLAKQLPEPEAIVAGILRQDRIMLSQAITLIESTRSDHAVLGQMIVEKCLPFSGKSIRLGVTGSPGVGKSTFIESFGTYLVGQGKKVAVLAVDPSSRLSKGSILGDKTRMEKLSNLPDAFIRPSPAGESLGGVARKTRETIILCEAAGFDTILIETVGVGQSETAVHSMVDAFLLLLQPGAGDELQGIKRGIVEMTDLLVVNKADGERIEMARNTRREYANALHLFPKKESRWTPVVLTCSALSGAGIPEVWQHLRQYFEHTRGNGFFEKKRREQAKYWLQEAVQAGLRQLFFQNEKIKAALSQMEEEVIQNRRSPFSAAEDLLKLIGK